MERDNRQRMVIEAMVKRVKGLPISKYNDLMNSVLPYVKTNMSPATILGLAKDVLSIGNFNTNFIPVPHFILMLGKTWKSWICYPI